jgi:integrase
LGKNLAINFTNKTLDNLPLSGKRQSYKDEKTRGLYLEITAKGKKTFSLIRSVMSKTYRHYIGVYPDVKIAQARQRAAELNSMLDRGQDPNAERDKKKNELTLNELFLIYYEKHAKQRNKRPEEVKGRYRLHLSKLGNKKLSKITKNMVIEHHISIKNAKSGRTANIMLAYLKSIYNRGIEWGYFEGVNPTNGIKKFKEISRSRFLSKAERIRFLEEVNALPDLVMKSFFLLLIYTGQRKNNILTMAWADIDLEGKLWVIPETKTDTNFRVPLSNKVVEILQELEQIKINDYVLPSFGKSGHLIEPKKAFKKILDNAEITNFRIHDLRRTFASMLSEQGVSEFTIKDLLGHKTLDMTAIYARSNIDSMQKAVDNLKV